MQTPPIRYSTTRDGKNIAYTICGEGRPFVLMPFPFNHLQNMWASPRNRSLFEPLAARFNLVQYDSRGHGMSSRGLGDKFSLDEYLFDLEAVIEQVGFDRCFLFGGPLFAHVAVVYAVKHPERLLGLILHNASSTGPWGGMVQFEQLAHDSWDLFIRTISSSTSTDERHLAETSYRESINQNDLLSIFRAAKDLQVDALWPLVRVPALITYSDLVPPEHAQRIAGAIPGARLVFLERYGPDLYSSGPEPPRVIGAVQEFVQTLEFSDEVPAAADIADKLALAEDLTPREVDVLRLAAEGKSNREIANDLVLSERTVINHLSHVYAKVGVKNRAGAVALALHQKLI